MGTNTGIGIGIGIPFRNNALGGDRPYFPPELKARMIGVWDNYGKKNTDADRNIIKNKIPNAGGDLEILNSAYKLNSGFGEYREDFTSWIVSKEPMTVEKTDSQVHISYIGTSYKELPMFEYSGTINENYSLTVEIQGIPNNIIGKFIHNNGFTQEVTNGINTIKFSNSGSWYGFTFYREDNTIIGDCNITIKQIPAFEGALVTDGINDIIASIKTLEDWNIGNKGITIVSMIHQINTNTNNFITTNNIRTDNKVIGRNIVSNIEKTGIYGWYKENIQSDTINVINNILGDKNDYTSHSSPSTNINPINNSKFYVQGYAIENGFAELSSVAHYWTFAVLGKATEDEINLIIAKYNLDRTLRPDIRCNIERQGITNDNHADFNDRLIDYSGNGRDIQMYNLAWKGGSGIAAKQYETFKDWTSESSSTSIIKQIDEFTRIVESTTNGYWVSRIRRDSDLDKVYSPINVYLYQDNNFLVHECKYEVDGVKYTIPINEPVGKGYHKLEMYTKDRYTELPENAENVVLSEWYFPKSTKGSIKYSIIPSCKGGILLDGINDFGKVIDMPIYKDYTFIIDREIISIGDIFGIVASKSESSTDTTKQGAFLFEYLGAPNNISTWSFYNDNHKVGETDFTKSISYQSKYSYNGKELTAGEAKDSDKLWLGTIRDRDSCFFNGAIYSLMSFPYSMSKFLIERQLKKYKLGTLYPNMVEFRPIIKANANYNIFYTALLPLTGIVWEKINIGDYIPVGRRVAIQLSFDNEASELVSPISSQLGNISITKNSNNKGYTIFGDILKNKSPQKINITIDEYIRYEDIVQPYPVLLRFNDENGNEVSWGGKLRVGSTITRIGSAADSNLLPNIYNIFGLLLNDNQVTSSKVIVEKTMVFKAKSAYIFDNNEPNCILSPRLLRIPNSSYKILGYIPDISGHGNHGVIHNSAYIEGSGVNEDGSYQFDGVNDFVIIPTVTGGGKQVLMKVNNNTISSMLYDQRSSGASPNSLNSDFAIYTVYDNLIAYQSRLVGKTYIDGILNTNITCEDLLGVLHNITITCDTVAPNNGVVPNIGRGGLLKDLYSNMALYDFMLFDEISTDDKIKELNTYIGITPKVTLPNYYWDNYGKKNTDANRGHVDEQVSLQKTGTSVNPLENFNISYEGMSGYNGYPVVFGASKTWESLSGVYGYTSNVTNTTIHVTHAEHAGNGLLFSYVKKDGALANIKEIPAFRVTIGGLEGNSKFGYRYLATEDATEETLVYLGNGTHELAKSFAPTEALLDLTRNVWVGIFITPMVEGEVVFDCDITIEVLPEYENGLAYDGVSDFSQNTEIEVVEDFTFLVKGSLLKGLTGSGGCIARKGDKKHYDTGGYAFIYCFDSPIESYRNSYYSFGKSFVPSKEIVAPPLIGYMTKTNVNGETTTFGTNSDIKGIIFGNWSSGYMNMVIYKSIFYTKTISLLEINFLKNLMEKDEIIDINHPIFISNTEDESNTSQDT